MGLAAELTEGGIFYIDMSDKVRLTFHFEYTKLLMSFDDAQN